MKAVVNHWMGKDFHIEGGKEENIIYYKQTGSRRKGYKREPLEAICYVVEFNTLEELLNICKQYEGMILRPPTELLPYYSIMLDDGGRFTKR